ncbi:MAG TPA: HD domain-containing protein [Brevefilum sp.]
MLEKHSLLEIIDFISYIDQLKNVIRKNGLHDASREENTAEHSWHAALSALLLAPYADQAVDIDRVIKMLLIHDLVEIEAGDTFVYNREEVAKQGSSEAQAANIILSKLPEQQGEMLQNLWDEFEARETPEAKFAKAIDRFLPLYSNIINHGYSWLPYGVTQNHVREINCIIKDGSTGLWGLVQEMLDEAVQEGYLNP